LAETFDHLLHTPLPLFDLKGWVKQGLMAIFFLYVGLELKREMIEGPFRNPKEAMLPAFAAVGGMAAPALLYLVFAPTFPRGWAIPTATDIAFAVGVLSLLGGRIPGGLRLFLLALAIVDDLGAILVIALFCASELAAAPLAWSAVIFLGLVAMTRYGVKPLWPYLMGGAALWAAMAGSGLSPTLAGVLTAAAVPMRRPGENSPLVKLEHALRLPVQLGIMPIFALAMAGAHVGDASAALSHPVTHAIAAGLVLGKPLGICAGAWLAAMLLKAPLPATPLGLLGASCIAGIGFTMSLFVGSLAFGGGHPEIDAAVRVGVLGGSLVSAGLGLLVLATTYQKRSAESQSPLAKEERIAERRGVFEDGDSPEN
jgi:NhaA family Na+:H+ antiporter